MNPLPWRPIWYEGVDGCVGDGVLIERLVVSHAPVLEPGVLISSVLFKNDFRIQLRLAGIWPCFGLVWFTCTPTGSHSAGRTSAPAEKKM